MAQSTFNNGDALSVVRTTINANANNAESRLAELEQPFTKVIPVFSTSDLPAPSAGVITLATSDVRYQVYGPINIGADRINITADNVQIQGMTFDSGFIYSGTVAALSAIETLSITGMTFVGLTASELVHAQDGDTSALFCIDCVFVGGSTTKCISVNGYKTALVNRCAFQGGDKGIELSNAVSGFTVHFCQFENLIGFNIDYNGSICDATTIDNCAAVLSATGTFINAAVDSGNIAASGGGTIANNKIDTSEVGSVIAVGLSPLDLGWLFLGNNNLVDSDRINPTGWAFYDDGDTVTTTVPALEANAVKFTNDGLGPNSSSAFEPRVIRGLAEMWDTATDEIVPITLGDSFNIRIAFSLTAKSGNPTLLTIVLDIGGGSTITIPIFTQSIATPNSFPRMVTISAPIFALGTFLANNGQIFMYTDAGSVDVETRRILIQRVSSGAS